MMCAPVQEQDNVFPPATSHRSGQLRTNDSTNSRWTKSSGVTNIFLVQEAISLGYTPQKERKDHFYFMLTLSGLEKSSMDH